MSDIIYKEAQKVSNRHEHREMPTQTKQLICDANVCQEAQKQDTRTEKLSMVGKTRLLRGVSSISTQTH